MRAPAVLIALAAFVGVALFCAAGGGAAASARGVAARAPVTIRMGEYFFKPRRVTVHVGQRVRFVNVGKIEHTVADTNAKGAIRSRLIKPRPLAHGDVQSVRFHSRGLVRYLCTFHPTLMKGRILVVR